jgi:hypothetical protein
MTQMSSMLHSHIVIMIFDSLSVPEALIPSSLRPCLVQCHRNLGEKVNFVVVHLVLIWLICGTSQLCHVRSSAMIYVREDAVDADGSGSGESQKSDVGAFQP